MRKSELRKRREKISHYLVQGLPVQEITKELGVSSRTVERDVAYLKSEYKDWQFQDDFKECNYHELYSILVSGLNGLHFILKQKFIKDNSFETIS